MIFERDDINLHFLRALYLNQENVNIKTNAYDDAVSFRFSSDTVLQTEVGIHRMQDYSVSYVPKAVPYTRVGSREILIAVFFESDDYIGNDIESFTADNPEVFSDLFLKIMNCYTEQKPGYKFQCSALLHNVFCECYKQTTKSLFKESRIQASIDYINKNFRSSSLSVKDAAAQSFISEVQFRQHFKEEFLTSPRKYIMKLRIEHAITLMREGYYSLSEIADLCGYNDNKYFSTSFKKLLGCSPSEYLSKIK